MRISYSTWKWLLIGCGLALLLMMLAYPFGYDQAAFMVGGEMTVKHGAIPYRDFLDTKPPVIFIIYGISSIIFGHHEWSIRAFDILFQIASLFYFFKLLKRTTGDEKLAITSVFLYALFYVTSGFWMTAQAETFALLPTLIAFDLTERVQDLKSVSRQQQFLFGIVTGISCAIIFLLKFTLLTIPIGILIYLLLESRPFPRKYFTGVTSGLIGLVGFYALYLIETGSMVRFQEALDWVRHYADLNPLLAYNTISERYFKGLPMFSLIPFGLSGILVAVIGIYQYFSNRHSKPSTNEQITSTAFVHLFLQLCLGLLAVAYERKFFPYHFSRTYWAFVPFVALGIRELHRIWVAASSAWRRNLKLSNQIVRYSIASMISVALLFFSITTRIVSQPLFFTYQRLLGKDVASIVQDEMSEYYYKDELQLADKLRPLMGTNDQIFLWGNSVGLYYFLEKYPTTIVLTNTPLISSWTPSSWKEKLISQLKANPPLFFIAESADQREFISGSKLDSWQHLLKWTDLREFVATMYDRREDFGHFRIFERK